MIVFLNLGLAVVCSYEPVPEAQPLDNQRLQSRGSDPGFPGHCRFVQPLGFLFNCAKALWDSFGCDSALYK